MGITTDEDSDTPDPLFDTLSYFRSGNFSYYVPRCLSKLGPLSMPVEYADGKYWILNLDRQPKGKIALLVGLDASTQTLYVEAPLVELPSQPTAPILRSALEINGQLARGFRISLRYESLVLRSAAPASALRPMRLVGLVTSFADFALDLERFLVSRFGCRSLSPPASAGYRPPARRLPVRISLDAAGI